MATAGQPPLFPANDAPALTEAQRREELFRKQVELGTPADQARAYADRVVLRTGVPRKKAAAAKRGKKAGGGAEASPKAADALAGLASPLESLVVDADSGSVVEEGSRRGLLPVHHPNRDFFLCDLFDYALKDDGVSMEAPIFTLATKPDTKVWHWESKDKSRAVTVTPSVLGRATQHDKDLLIYVVSQITEALNRGRGDAANRTVRFRVYDYLVSTNKRVGGKEYQRLQDALERLRGTSIKTNIQTGGERVKEGFGIVDSWKIIEKSPDDDRMIGVEVTLSRWLFNAVQAREVLTISNDYFRLRKPLERRLYELARKHCGHQPDFTITVELLCEKCGSQGTIREFRRMLKEIIEDDLLPDYTLVPDWKNGLVVMQNRKMALPGKARQPA
ncbi:MAG TPA: replication initiator protein A [Aquabacterium sp.]|nr:replication initiator protein A [Aquabacterium sp.]